MNLFKRLAKIGQAEAHAAIDNMEDPIHMSEQAIRDMRTDLEQSLEALAQVKAMSIRARNEIEDYSQKATDYTQKALLLLQKSKRGEIAATEADRLAREALLKKEEAGGQVKRAQAEKEQFDQRILQMEVSIAQIKQEISKWENELKTLRARIKVADATKNLNKQMARIDSHGTVATLERMKEKVMQEEALAEAYGDMAGTARSIDAEIDQAVNLNAGKADTELAAMKAQLGITDPDPEQTRS